MEEELSSVLSSTPRTSPSPLGATPRETPEAQSTPIQGTLGMPQVAASHSQVTPMNYSPRQEVSPHATPHMVPHHPEHPGIRVASHTVSPQVMGHQAVPPQASQMTPVYAAPQQEVFPHATPHMVSHYPEHPGICHDIFNLHN